jgi:hypothetical protein
MSARTTSRSTKTGRRSSAKTVLERLTGAEAHTRRCCLVCAAAASTNVRCDIRSDPSHCPRKTPRRVRVA